MEWLNSIVILQVSGDSFQKKDAMVLVGSICSVTHKSHVRPDRQSPTDNINVFQVHDSSLTCTQPQLQMYKALSPGSWPAEELFHTGGAPYHRPRSCHSLTYSKPESPVTAESRHSPTAGVVRYILTLDSDQMAHDVISDSVKAKFSLVGPLPTRRRDQQDTCMEFNATGKLHTTFDPLALARYNVLPR